MNELVEPFARMLADHAGRDSLWPEVEASGFLDALVPEDRGGVGLTLADAGALAQAFGRSDSDAPFVTTLVDRAGTGGRETLAALTAAEIAGGLEAILDMTLEHANTRVQFGRPIGKFQAIQQQLAVMAEHTVLARIAAQFACAADATPERAGVGKYNASAAVPICTGIAHAVHGAIGITAEYPLAARIRRLHQLRMAHGSEGYWADVIGAARLSRDVDTLEFARTI